jgi:Co/Zn/Cd efflux system component
MGASCCASSGPSSKPPVDTVYRRVLWAALAINATMFLVEIVAGAAAGSVSLKADAMDFLGDAANYAISLIVLGMALAWRARAALLKGLSLGAVGLWVAGETAYNAIFATVPEAEIMGAIGLLALAANVGCALLLYAYRTGDANRRSVWICSRNDAIGNIAVMLAALGVFGTGTGWPDLVDAAVMASLSVSGAVQIVRQSRAELRVAAAPAAAA